MVAPVIVADEIHIVQEADAIKQFTASGVHAEDAETGNKLVTTCPEQVKYACEQINGSNMQHDITLVMGANKSRLKPLGQALDGFDVVLDENAGTLRWRIEHPLITNLEGRIHYLQQTQQFFELMQDKLPVSFVSPISAKIESEIDFAYDNYKIQRKQDRGETGGGHVR